MTNIGANINVDTLFRGAGGGGGGASGTMALLEAMTPHVLYRMRDASGTVTSAGSLGGSDWDLDNIVGQVDYQEASGDLNPDDGEYSIELAGNGLDAFLFNNTGDFSGLATEQASGGVIHAAIKLRTTGDEHTIWCAYPGGSGASATRLYIDPTEYNVEAVFTNNLSAAYINYTATNDAQGWNDGFWHVLSLVQPKDGVGAYFILDGNVGATIASVLSNKDLWIDDYLSAWDHHVIGGYTNTANPTSVIDEFQGWIDFFAITALASDADIIAMHKSYLGLVDMTVGGPGPTYGYLSGSYGAIDQEPIAGHTLTQFNVNGSNLMVADFNGEDINAGGNIKIWLDRQFSGGGQVLTWNGSNNRYEATVISTVRSHLFSQLGSDSNLRMVKV